MKTQISKKSSRYSEKKRERDINKYKHNVYTTMDAEIREWGNSWGILLPKKKLEEIGAKRGDIVKIEIIAKKKIDGFGIYKGAKPFKREEDEHEDLW